MNDCNSFKCKIWNARNQCRDLINILFLCFISAVGFTQEIKVNGRVLDASGEVVVGATIIVKGTSHGTTSDIDGQYELSNVDVDTVLIFSYVGMNTQEVKVNAQNRIDVVLEEGAIGLKEVVVVGYGTQRKSDLTGSIASADIDAFRESPNVNIMQSLQGSVPGVQIGQVNQAGESPSIRVRGQSTLNGSKSPLIVVDGIIFKGRIGDLNPADIASIDVLKDASSKAIYGAQAANGVIIITSKSGKVSQKPIINYSGSISTQKPTVNARLLNREEVLQKVRDIEYQNAYLGPNFTELNPSWNFDQSELSPRLLQGVENGTDYDWWDALTSPGYIVNHVLSVSGGNNNTKYYMSGGYTDQEGFVLNDNYTRSTARINISTDVAQWLTIGANTYGAFTDMSGVYPDMNYIALTSPLVKPVDENGDFVINHLGDQIVNPFLSAQADDRDLNNRISGNLFFNIEVPRINGLSYRMNFNNNLYWSSHSISNEYGAGLTGSASKIHTSNYDLMLDNILTYDRTFGNHGLNLTLVAGYNKVKYDMTQASGESFSNLGLSYNSLEQGLIRNINSGAWEEVSTYQMGRVNYKFKNRYILTGTLRRDGFSGFSVNNKFGLFPSLGIGWVISEEAFMNIAQIDFLKLRASYGQNGNKTSRYSSLARISSGEGNSYVFGDGASTSLGQSPSSLANSSLTWETTTGLNVGLDFGILNERVRGNIEYYSTVTTDLLWDVNLPQLTGFSEIKTNLGIIENAGVEFELQISPLRTKSFQWDINLNFAHNQNRIDQLLGDDLDGDGIEDDLISSGLFIGESIGAIYNYEVNGIWQVNDEIPEGYYPGTYSIVDQNNDGVISAADDRIILGREEPAFRFGIQNTIKFENFSLRFFVNSIQGGKNGYLRVNNPTGVSGTTGTAQNRNWFDMYDYWSPQNPNAMFATTWTEASINASRYIARDFIRLQDVSLSYNLSSREFKKINVKNAKIYISGKNLLTLTKWPGWDPETGQGIGNRNAFPVMKAYTVGLDISF